MSLRRLKKHLRKISEATTTTNSPAPSAVGAASGGVQGTTTVGSSTSTSGSNTASNAVSNAQQEENANLQKAATDQDLKNKVPFTKDDVDKMTPGEIINYVYVSMPTNIDPETKRALLLRADQMRNDAQAQRDVKERARQILRGVGSNINIGL